MRFIRSSFIKAQPNSKRPLELENVLTARVCSLNGGNLPVLFHKLEHKVGKLRHTKLELFVRDQLLIRRAVKGEHEPQRQA